MDGRTTTRTRCPECGGSDLRVEKRIWLPALAVDGKAVVDWGDADMQDGFSPDDEAECLECGWDGLAASVVAETPEGCLEPLGERAAGKRRRT